MSIPDTQPLAFGLVTVNSVSIVIDRYSPYILARKKLGVYSYIIP